jgi:hypothetical protein
VTVQAYIKNFHSPLAEADPAKPYTNISVITIAGYISYAGALILLKNRTCITAIKDSG